MFALKLQEVVVAAFLAVRKFPADIRPRFVNGAATKFMVEKLTGGFVNIVRTMTKNAFVDMVIGVAFGEFILTGEGNLCCIVAQIKMLRQAVDVTFGDHDTWIATAIARAFAAVVIDFCICHGRHSIATWPSGAYSTGFETKT